MQEEAKKHIFRTFATIAIKSGRFSAEAFLVRGTAMEKNA